MSSAFILVFDDAINHFQNKEDESGMMSLSARMHSSVCHSYMFSFINMLFMLMLPPDVDREQYKRSYMESLSYVWGVLRDKSVFGLIPAIIPLDNGGDPMEILDAWNDCMSNENDPLVKEAREFAEYDVKRSYVYDAGRNIVPISLLRILKSSDWDNFKNEILNNPEYESYYEMWEK